MQLLAALCQYYASRQHDVLAAFPIKQSGLQAGHVRVRTPTESNTKHIFATCTHDTGSFNSSAVAQNRSVHDPKR